jgi:hypothetical protein
MKFPRNARRKHGSYRGDSHSCGDTGVCVRSSYININIMEILTNNTLGRFVQIIVHRP